MTRKAVILLLMIIDAGVLFAQPRVQILLDKGWRFARENPPGAGAPAFNDSRWEKISVPHTWNNRDGQDGGNDYYRGTGWYRTRVSIGRSNRDKSVFLKFDGVATVATLFVNGNEIGTHKGNFGAFCFDITPYVRFGDPTIIAVRVNNARDTAVAPLRGDFTIFGGIYRAVRLLLLEKTSISPLDYASSGVYVRQQEVTAESAVVSVITKLRNSQPGNRDVAVRVSIIDAKGAIVTQGQTEQIILPGKESEASCPLIIRKPRLWNGRNDPYLYAVQVDVTEGSQLRDRVTETYGLRSFAVDPEKGFSLNGQSYRLYGVNRHQDRESKGWAIGPREHQEDYSLIQEMGCTAVRLAHYQHAKEFYDLCDRGGMVVWAELSLVDEIHPSSHFLLNCEQQLTELIKQNYNHPSIVFWGLQNELVPEPDTAMYGNVVARLNDLAKHLDPSRLTAVASRSKYDNGERMNSISDVLGYNVYRGWYEGKPEGFGRFADTVRARLPRRPIGITEYGAGGSIHQHEYPPRRPETRGPWHPEEWQSVLHEVTWKAIEQRPFLWGAFVWNMFDFASDGRAEGDSPGRNDKGLVSYDRKVRKDAFYWYKANWNSDPIVYITSKRFNPRPSGKTEVKVYSNCDSVTVTLNGRPLGTCVSADRRFVWSGIELQPGRNRIEATGFRNGRGFTDSCVWETTPTTVGGTL